MIDELPAEWERVQLPGSVDRTRRPGYVAYRHESGDVRIRVLQPNAELDRTGYGLVATLYPGTELAESTEIRTVATERRAASVVASFMKLFEGRYDGPSSTEAALNYAIERTRPPDVVRDSFAFDEP